MMFIAKLLLVIVLAGICLLLGLPSWLCASIAIGSLLWAEHEMAIDRLEKKFPW